MAHTETDGNDFRVVSAASGDNDRLTRGCGGIPISQSNRHLNQMTRVVAALKPGAALKPAASCFPPNTLYT